MWAEDFRFWDSLGLAAVSAAQNVCGCLLETLPWLEERIPSLSHGTWSAIPRSKRRILHLSARHRVG